MPFLTINEDCLAFKYAEIMGIVIGRIYVRSTCFITLGQGVFQLCNWIHLVVMQDSKDISFPSLAANVKAQCWPQPSERMCY